MLDSTRSSALNTHSSNGHRTAHGGFPLASLQQVPLFTGLSPEALKTMSRVVKRRILIPDELLLSEDDMDSTLFLIMEGAFKITVRKGKGTVLLGLCGRGELLGELAVIDGHARSATVTAQTDCVVGVVSACNFWETMWPVAPIPSNMAHLLTGRVRRLTAKVQAMATLNVRARLAFQLVMMARDHAEKIDNGSCVIPFDLTQMELSQMVGASRVQINQLMKNWSDSDILTSTRSSITIHDLKALCQCFPPSLGAIAPRPARELN